MRTTDIGSVEEREPLFIATLMTLDHGQSPVTNHMAQVAARQRPVENPLRAREQPVAGQVPAYAMYPDEYRFCCAAQQCLRACVASAKPTSNDPPYGPQGKHYQNPALLQKCQAQCKQTQFLRESTRNEATDSIRR